MTAVRGVEGISAVEQTAGKRLRMGVGFKGARAASENVGHDAGGERDDVADNAGQHESEQAERDSRAVASEIGHEPKQVSRGGGTRLRLLRFLRDGPSMSGFSD